MRNSIWIRNGRTLDPGSGGEAAGDILTLGGRIAEFSPEAAGKAVETLDAAGCLVLPGLIDFHAHLARRMTDTGVNADLMTLPNGITSAVDAGSVGPGGADAFARLIVGGSEADIRFFVNVSPAGVSAEKLPESGDPACFDEEALLEACERHPDLILGLKIRLGRGFSDGRGLKPLVRAKEIARRAGKPLCAHATNPEFTCPDFLDLLEKGDIFCHCYQGMGAHTILDASGQVCPAAWRARERGVIFDVAAGRINCDFAVARRAIEEGFLPDVISSDAVSTSVYQPKLFHLVQVMSAFLALGMPLRAVVGACSSTPAALMGMAGRLGSLAPGALADLAVFRLREQPLEFRDNYGHTAPGNLLLVPLATVKSGKSVYKRIDFIF